MPVEPCNRAKILDVREQRRLAAPLEFREDAKDNQVVLEGYAATYEPYDCYGGVERGGWIEQIDKRAFDITLAQQPDVQLLLNHEGLPLARTTSRTLQLSADNRGLKVRAILDSSDPDVQRILPKMRRGDLNEMSFAFRVKDQVWSNDYTQRTITEVSLQRGDVSVVSYGMNPDTKATVEMLARMSQDDLVELRKLDQDELKKALDVLAQATGEAPYSVPGVGAEDLRAAGNPSSPSGNPSPNMQDSMIIADKEKDTDPSDPSGAAIESGIHHEPAVSKTGNADSPVKKIIEPGSSPLMLTLVAALQSTISHAHSVASTNGDSSRSLIAEAVEQIEELVRKFADAPREENEVERKLKELRNDVGRKLKELRGQDEFDAVAAMREKAAEEPDDEEPESEEGECENPERSEGDNPFADEKPEGEKGDGDDEEEDEEEERAEIGSVSDVLSEIRREKGVPEINSVADGLAYLASLRRN